jgi:hypothetical protein
VALRLLGLLVLALQGQAQRVLVLVQPVRLRLLKAVRTSLRLDTKSRSQ